jgi:hypothetical protein
VGGAWATAAGCPRRSKRWDRRAFSACLISCSFLSASTFASRSCLQSWLHILTYAYTCTHMFTHMHSHMYTYTYTPIHNFTQVTWIYRHAQLKLCMRVYEVHTVLKGQLTAAEAWIVLPQSLASLPLRPPCVPHLHAA